MRLTLIFLLVIGIVTISPAQKRNKEEYPEATSAEKRWEGYMNRLELEENSLVKKLPFRNIGPTVMSGRVTDLAVNPKDPTHFYVAYASGSLWETTNNGTSFAPIFDQEIVMTIGDIAVDWNNEVIYVGTGENNSSRSSYSGFGIFKSGNNGKNWEHLGLEETHHIGRILIHPDNPQVLWVAAIGHLYSENPERGIFKSIDGGVTWSQCLFVNNRTGVIDLAMQPGNPNVLIAAAWERDRKAWNFEESGPGTAIYRSEDGGDSWKEIPDDSGFPDTSGAGRIGLGFSTSSPNVIYAFLDNQDRKQNETAATPALSKDMLRNMNSASFLALKNQSINEFLDEYGFDPKYNAVDLKNDVEKGRIQPNDLVLYVEDANSLMFDTPIKGGEMYRSNDSGKTWKKTHEGYLESTINTYGYYFGQVRVDANNPDVVYTMGVPIIKSEDGGKTWGSISKANVHADHHALWINPENSDHLILGNDGGINISYDRGDTWIFCNSPAVGQFYSVNVDMAEPYNVYGGLQDNGTWKGPSDYEYSRSWYSEGRYPYEKLMGGDGMQVAVDTRDNTTVYIGYQYGNYFRVNTQTGKRTYITPKHELGDPPLRWNWEAPIMLSSHNQDIVYFGSNRFHRSMNQGGDFETLSKDLTNGGKKGDVSFGTLTTIHESPLRFGLIYVGSDDGVIQRSNDAGQTWERISDDLPQNYWVSQVFASNHKEGRVYVSLNGYRWDNFSAMVYVSEDYGATWKPIHGNLPTEPVNVVKEDPANENIIYAGTDHGLYVSLDMGQTYHAFKGGLPNVAMHDLVIHPREKELVVGTHGRSIFIGDVSGLQQMTNELLESKLHIFELQDIIFSERWGSKWWYWGEEFNPEISVSFYSQLTTNGKIEVVYKDETVISKEIPIDRGLNYQTIELMTDESFKNLLDDEKKAAYDTAENGKYYLVPGDYAVKVKAAEATVYANFTIEKPKEKSKRKE